MKETQNHSALWTLSFIFSHFSGKCYLPLFLQGNSFVFYFYIDMLLLQTFTTIMLFDVFERRE